MRVMLLICCCLALAACGGENPKAAPKQSDLATRMLESSAGSPAPTLGRDGALRLDISKLSKADRAAWTHSSQMITCRGGLIAPKLGDHEHDDHNGAQWEIYTTGSAAKGDPDTLMLTDSVLESLAASLLVPKTEPISCRILTSPESGKKTDVRVMSFQVASGSASA